ncbi:MAG TPA: class I SAM-dependent methyltransferase [Gammaproteobacteria bacterium]|nr:class I SAM-dependent methyltransferase [Gammaproteobacteria bacterium]
MTMSHVPQDSAALDENKRRLTALFDELAPHYDCAALRFFPFCADRLVQRMALRPGEKLLDVATGTGAVATAAAQALAPGGRVTGIDLSEGMLDKAQFNARKMGLTNVDFHWMDAEAPEFRSAYFDAVCSSFGVFFLDDMHHALTQWRRVLKPGGRALFTCFGPDAFQPMAEILRAQLQANGVDFPEGRRSFPWLRLSAEQDCRQLLEGAGFVDVRVERESLGYHLSGVEEWWEVVWNTGFRGFVERLDAPAREAFRERHLASVQDLVTANGLWLDIDTLFASGRRQDDD